MGQLVIKYLLWSLMTNTTLAIKQFSKRQKEERKEGRKEGNTSLSWIKPLDSTANLEENQKVKWSCLVVSDSVTPRTVAYQATQSMEFSRQEYWSGVPFPSPGDLPNSGIEPRSPALQADALLSKPPGK